MSKLLYNDLLKKIEDLSIKRNISLYKKILKENKLTTIKASITESQFGVFFDSYCDNLQYDFKFFNKTPDWCLTINGQKIIAEITRLNPSNQDQERNEELITLVNECKKLYPGMGIVTPSIRISHKPEKISEKLIDKANTYGELVEAQNLPYLICLAFDYFTGLESENLEWFLYGQAEAPFKKSNDMGKPEYEQLQKNVSGVLLLAQNEQLYFHNYCSINRLNEPNLKWLNGFTFNNSYS